MLDDVYQDGTNAAIEDLARRPLPAPPPDNGFSFWGMLRGVPRGAAAGGAESLALGADAIGAMSDVQTSYDYNRILPLGVATDQGFYEPAARSAQERLKSAEAFTSQEGAELRALSRDFLMPDPTTTHTAEQVVAGVSKFLTKAVGYSAVTGGVGGPLLTGLDEGMTVSDDLRMEGVDLKTRTKVGALAGASAAAGVALPVVGVGIKSTGALVAVGGTGAFMAQQAATRAILENADYSSLADQYDPFDPVGLAVSTLAPAIFGGLALRGRARASRAAAAGEGAPISETGAEPGSPVGADPAAVDAARVSSVSETLNASRLSPADDIAGADAHVRALARAGDQMADGTPVDVGDILDPAQLYTARAQDLARSLQPADEAAPMVNDSAPAEGSPPVAVRGVSNETDPGSVETPVTAPRPAAAPGRDAEQGVQRPALPEPSPRLAGAIASKPDMPIVIDETGPARTLSEVLDTIRQDAQRNDEDASLLSVAANCFLSL